VLSSLKDDTLVTVRRLTGPAVTKNWAIALPLLKISFSSKKDHRWPRKVGAMQLQQPNNLGEIGSFSGVTRNQPPSPRASMDSPHYLSPAREEALQLLNSESRNAEAITFQ
jgi:hypothetical protein